MQELSKETVCSGAETCTRNISDVVMYILCSECCVRGVSIVFVCLCVCARANVYCEYVCVRYQHKFRPRHEFEHMSTRIHALTYICPHTHQGLPLDSPPSVSLHSSSVTATKGPWLFRCCWQGLREIAQAGSVHRIETDASVAIPCHKILSGTPSRLNVFHDLSDDVHH